MSESSDSEVFEFVPKVRPARLAPSAPQPVERSGLTASTNSKLSKTPDGNEELFETLESVGELLEETKRLLTGLESASVQLEGEARQSPDWLRPVLEACAAPRLPAAIDALDGLALEVGKEKDRLGGAPIAQEKDNGVGRTKAVRTFLSAMRAYHTKCAKQFDELLKGEESSQVISTSPAAGSNSSASLPTVVGNSSTSLPTVVASPSSSSSSLPDVSASNIPAAFTGRPPPPLPARKTVSEADDPFSEQPLTPVEPSLIRARSKSNVMLGGGPPPPVVSAPPPSVSPPTSPRETGLATTPPSSKSLAARGRGSGRKGVDLGGARRGVASIGEKSMGADEKEKGSEFGSLARPLKVLARPNEGETSGESSLKFEVQRKSGLLLASNFSLTVSGGADPSLGIYDVKAQTSVTRPLSGVLNVTRSNKNPRKLKIHWKGEGCERFLFASPGQREAFVEAIWTFRRVVPLPNVAYAEPIDVFVGTWNLGDAMPASNIDAWLHPREFDLYVVSAQEAGYDLEKGQNGSAEAHFFGLLQSSLGPDYKLVASLSLLHIRMCVFVSVRHAHKVSNVRKASVATGIGNVIGNKGGCFVSLTLNETSFCFIGCHLAAREERYEQRCTNVQQILQGINAAQPPGLTPDSWFDYVVWTGDLNFRLVADRVDVCKWAKECNVEQLLKSDQLMQARRECKAFYQWTEPPISFSPSYRFDRGSMEFSEEKMRTPSYCDRVLFKCKPGLSVNVNKYDCCHSLTTSDHHPVYASLTFDARLPNPLTSRTSKAYLEFTDLTGVDLPFVALDREPPFLTFYSTVTQSGKMSKRSIIRGSAPKWQDAGVPRLKCLVASRSILGLGHVSISVRDGKNDIGQCVLSLAEALGPAPASFVAQLTCGGLPAGELRGKLWLRWSALDEEDDELGDDSVLERERDAGGAAPSAGGSAGGGAAAGAVEAIKTGYLLKQGSKVKSWKRRWFVLASNGELSYFAERKAQRPLDRLRVDSVAAAPNAGKVNCLAIRSDRRQLLFCADSAEDYDAWLKILSAVSAKKDSAQ